MKKLLLITASLVAISAAAPASAADLAARPYTKAPPMMAAIYDWSGFYIGINGGGATSRNSWDLVGGGPEGHHDLHGRHGRWTDRLSLADRTSGVRR